MMQVFNVSRFCVMFILLFASNSYANLSQTIEPTDSTDNIYKGWQLGNHFFTLEPICEFKIDKYFLPYYECKEATLSLSTLVSDSRTIQSGSVMINKSNANDLEVNRSLLNQLLTSELPHIYLTELSEQGNDKRIIYNLDNFRSTINNIIDNEEARVIKEKWINYPLHYALSLVILVCVVATVVFIWWIFNRLVMEVFDAIVDTYNGVINAPRKIIRNVIGFCSWIKSRSNAVKESFLGRIKAKITNYRIKRITEEEKIRYEVRKRLEEKSLDDSD